MSVLVLSKLKLIKCACNNNLCTMHCAVNVCLVGATKIIINDYLMDEKGMWLHGYCMSVRVYFHSPAACENTNILMQYPAI